MTLCRTCGMSSRTDDFCERCRQPLVPAAPAMAPGAQPTLQMQPLTQTQTIRRVSLTGEVVETTQAMATQHYPGGPPAMQPARPGQQYPGGRPIDSQMAGAVMPLSAYSAAALNEQLKAEGPSLGDRWEKALAIALPILVLSMLLVHFAPSAMLGMVFGNMLVLPMVLGAVGAIPRYEDSILDCSIMLVVAILFGPVIALGVYLLTALVKQECNGAIVALLGINILLKAVFGIAFAPAVDTLSLAALWGLLNWLSFFGVCLSFLGWLLSSFFRGMND
jgi:hypothetical protein